MHRVTKIILCPFINKSIYRNSHILARLRTGHVKAEKMFWCSVRNHETYKSLSRLVGCQQFNVDKVTPIQAIKPLQSLTGLPIQPSQHRKVNRYTSFDVKTTYTNFI